MNDKPRLKYTNTTLVAFAATLFLGVPVACGDDDSNGDFADAGAGGKASGGGSATGGKSSGGTPGSGGKATGGVSSGGAGGGPGSGGASTGGAAAGGASSGGTPASGGTGSGGTSESGGSGSGGEVPDGSVDEDGGGGLPDGGVTGCSGQLSPNTANLCLTYTHDAIEFGATPTPDLDGKGTLIVQVFSKASPTAPTDLIDQKTLGGPTGAPSQVNVADLPSVGFSGLPTTVYVRTLLVDNDAWLVAKTGLTYGMFVGGYNLNTGVRPTPPLREVTLTNGEQTTQNQRLTALRKFSANVALYPGNPQAEPPRPAITGLDDGQGALTVGVFDEQNPVGKPIRGGGEMGCVNMRTGPKPAVGFFYILGNPTADTKMWFGGQVDDYNVGGQQPPGAIVSVYPSGPNPSDPLIIPPTQNVDVAPGAYSVTLQAPIVLTGYVPTAGQTLTPYACPVAP